ncbi:MAG: hypothetical protein JF606_09595 [Burkholderiales bacterium]|nr:hypothetical protein [Burkholderiales bacterium]
MKTTVMLLACAFAAALSGCTRIEEAAMPAPAKVNAAYPPPPEVQAARDRLLGLLAGDTKQVDAVKAQIESRMALRGLACSQQVSIGRLDSVAFVKALGLDQICFQAQDQAVQDFLGTRTVGVLMSLPPLRPLKPATAGTPLPQGPLSYITDGTFASQAGVAVLRDTVGDATVVELPTGAVIAKLPRMMTSPWASRVSPNGRVLALQQTGGQGVTFFDTSNGHRLWDRLGGQNVLTWLPEVTGFVIAERSGVTTLADGLTGNLAPHPLAPKNSSVATSLPGSAARTLLGSARELVLMEHQRAPAGLQATELKRLHITAGQGISSGQPVSMQQGRLVVFTSHPHISWLNLESGESGTYRTSPTFGATFAKLDENRLLVDSLDLTDRMRLNPWVFDIAAQVVAPVDPAGMQGLLIPTGDRPGFMRRGQGAWVADVVKTTSEPVPLDKVAAEYELQAQLAKLQAQVDAQQSQERSATASATARATAPAMMGLPRDAVVHMIGAYEGTGSSRANRSIRVVVRHSPRPLVLALSSYESVRWVIVNQGAKISTVLLSSYEPSTVIGLLDTPVQRMGSSYAYEAGSPEHKRWRQEVQQYIGPLDIRSFQGQYTGKEFSVGGS